MNTATASDMSQVPDIYAGDLARHQLAYDAEDYRRSLYTTAETDHPADWATGEPCDCQADGTRWERNGIAMEVHWPPSLRREATESGRHAEAEMEAE
jgi:hypothetical protein